MYDVINQQENVRNTCLLLALYIVVTLLYNAPAASEYFLNSHPVVLYIV